MQELENLRQVRVKQIFEMGELIGFETRNKYQLMDDRGETLGRAYEENRGILGLLLNQLLGHWRRFTVHFYDQRNQLFMRARHPFRFFFQRLEIEHADGKPLAVLQQRFSILYKSFDVLDLRGYVIMKVRSPVWRPWTFPFYGSGSRQAQQMGLVVKQWSGLLSEAFTDRDNFLIEFGPDCSLEHKKILLACALFIDLQYFERKAK